jgi:PAS domain S-box-containing protein
MTSVSLSEWLMQYIEEEAALLMFILDSNGSILKANCYAGRLVGEELQQQKLTDIIVDFTGTVKLPDLVDEPDRVHLLNIKTAGGLPQTFYFRFLRVGSEILAIGEINSIELETLRKELVNANNELSNLGRELQKKNAELLKLNALKNELLEEVRASEERYRLVVENATEAIVIAQDGKFKFVNRVACEITGYSEGKLLSCPFLDFIHCDDRSMVMDSHLRRLRGETLPTRYPFRFVDKDGGTRWVEIGAAIIEWEGRPATLNLLTDITERKQAEAERVRLEAENRQLQKAESLGRMAGAIAHLFNNHLAVVTGNLELAMMDMSGDVPIRKNLIEAIRAARRSSEVSGLMLTYLGQTTDKGEPLDISEVCRQNLPMLRDDIPEVIALKTDLLSSGPIVRANVNQVQQVLTHLITNGWESIGHSAGTVTLATRIIPASEIPKSHLAPVDWKPVADAFSCLEVTDTGCGIAGDDLDKIFDPFYTTKFTGRGLGLAVVLGNVKNWGGGIGVESKKNQGSTFRVFLPLVR